MRTIDIVVNFNNPLHVCDNIELSIKSIENGKRYTTENLNFLTELYCACILRNRHSNDPEIYKIRFTVFALRVRNLLSSEYNVKISFDPHLGFYNASSA